MKYAARRAQGRALAAEAIQHGEYRLPPKYDGQPDAGKLQPLLGEVRLSLTAAFDVHEAEKSAAFS